MVLRNGRSRPRIRFRGRRRRSGGRGGSGATFLGPHRVNASEPRRARGARGRRRGTTRAAWLARRGSRTRRCGGTRLEHSMVADPDRPRRREKNPRRGALSSWRAVSSVVTVTSMRRFSGAVFLTTNSTTVPRSRRPSAWNTSSQRSSRRLTSRRRATPLMMTHAMSLAAKGTSSDASRTGRFTTRRNRPRAPAGTASATDARTTLRFRDSIELPRSVCREPSLNFRSCNVAPPFFRRHIRSTRRCGTSRDTTCTGGRGRLRPGRVQGVDSDRRFSKVERSNDPVRRTPVRCRDAGSEALGER